MVKLRLKRMGSKFNAFYRIVAADARAPRDGKYIEEIGYYNPNSKAIKINHELKEKWLKRGAKPSETVKRLFSKASKISSDDKVVVLPKKAKRIKKTTPAADTSKVSNAEKADTNKAPSAVAPEAKVVKEDAKETTPAAPEAKVVKEEVKPAAAPEAKVIKEEVKPAAAPEAKVVKEEVKPAAAPEAKVVKEEVKPAAPEAEVAKEDAKEVTPTAK